MKLNQLWVTTVICSILTFTGIGLAKAEDSDSVDGVFGIDPIPPNSAFAVWVPLDSESSIVGFRWFNNDFSSGFSEVLAVAGEYGSPELLADATVVAENVHGVTQGWSELTFSQAISSGSTGLYLVLHLEEGPGFQQVGYDGGLGVGYFVGSAENNCWISGDGVEWDPLDSSFQMAVYPVQNSQKTGEVLRLTPPGKVENPTLHGETENPEFVESDLSSGKVSASPNPFNPNTTIHFDLPEGCPAKVAVFDIRGMLVRNLVNENLGAGHHSIPWNGRDNSGRLLASGRYIVHVQAGRLQTTTPVVLVK